MHIDGKLISYLEDLSCLTLQDAEKQRITEDLGEILGGMARLEELNTETAPERSHPFDNVNAFRDDKTQASFDRKHILQNAPESTGEMFIAPPTVKPLE